MFYGYFDKNTGFMTGWRNFKSRYKDIADAWCVLDANNPSVVLLSGERSKYD